MSRYQEHDKLMKIQNQSQAIGEFLKWFQNKYTICTLLPVKTKIDSWGNIDLVEDKEALHPLHSPVHVHITELLSEYFGIDQNVLEEEKRQMLEELRK